MKHREPRFELGGATDREVVGEPRAIAWRKHLSARQFAARNLWLYDHPYGCSRIETFLLREPESGEILTSMDVLKLPLLARGKKRDGFLIASVVTPAHLRGRGLASRMLGAYFDLHPESSGILHSDIGPDFYARFGFVARPVTMVSEPVRDLSAPASEGEPISLETFCDELERHRRNLEGAAVCPDSGFLDWQVHKYRFYAREAGRDLSEPLFRRFEHQGAIHWLVTLPDPLTSRLDLFWKAEECTDCLASAARLAKTWGLTQLRYWTRNPVPGGSPECPMVRVGGEKAARFEDPQLMDWW